MGYVKHMTSLKTELENINALLAAGYYPESIETHIQTRRDKILARQALLGERIRRQDSLTVEEARSMILRGYIRDYRKYVKQRLTAVRYTKDGQTFIGFSLQSPKDKDNRGLAVELATYNILPPFYHHDELTARYTRRDGVEVEETVTAEKWEGPPVVYFCNLLEKMLTK